MQKKIILNPSSGAENDSACTSTGATTSPKLQNCRHDNIFLSCVCLFVGLVSWLVVWLLLVVVVARLASPAYIALLFGAVNST